MNYSLALLKLGVTEIRSLKLVVEIWLYPSFRAIIKGSEIITLSLALGHSRNISNRKKC